MLKKLFFGFLILLFAVGRCMAQENTYREIHEQDYKDYGYYTFQNILMDIYQAALDGKLTVYKDSTLDSAYAPADIKNLGLYSETFTVFHGCFDDRDTTVYLYLDPEALTSISINSSHSSVALNYKYYLARAKTLFWFRQSDLLKLLGKKEREFMEPLITAATNDPQKSRINKAQLVKYCSNIYEETMKILYRNIVEQRLPLYMTDSLTTKMTLGYFLQMLISNGETGNFDSLFALKKTTAGNFMGIGITEGWLTEDEHVERSMVAVSPLIAPVLKEHVFPIQPGGYAGWQAFQFSLSAGLKNFLTGVNNLRMLHCLNTDGYHLEGYYWLKDE
jgi:hypothetical protein